MFSNINDITPLRGMEEGVKIDFVTAI